MIRIKDNSVYFNNPYPAGFGKKYKGVLIVVDVDFINDDGNDGFHFSIRNRKKSETIYKTRQENMYRLIFDDSSCSISCDFERNEDNKSPRTLYFPVETYDEIKNNLPNFMEICGCKFSIIKVDSKMFLEF